MMKLEEIINYLKSNDRVYDYRINQIKRESYELFFVHRNLETVRATDILETKITIYCKHDNYLGDSQFDIYSSTTLDDLKLLVDKAINKALLIKNEFYNQVENVNDSVEIESNFKNYDMKKLGAMIADCVFSANKYNDCSLNSVEIFLNKINQRIINSRNVDVTQIRYTAMIEAIPTYNGDKESVELYEQYNFNFYDFDTIKEEIAEKLEQVKARYNAIKPDNKIACNIILNAQEILELMWNFANDLYYHNVYSNSNLYKRDDLIQDDAKGDLLNISLKSEIKGCSESIRFDSTGFRLKDVNIINNGKIMNYHGSYRFAQYLNEEATGALPCIEVECGNLSCDELKHDPYLEILSMSGLQVDLYNDYIGGEIRLAYYYDGNCITPLTGISISGSLKEALNNMKLSKEATTFSIYKGPKLALFKGINII